MPRQSPRRRAATKRVCYRDTSSSDDDNDDDDDQSVHSSRSDNQETQKDSDHEQDDDDDDEADNQSEPSRDDDAYSQGDQSDNDNQNVNDDDDDNNKPRPTKQGRPAKQKNQDADKQPFHCDHCGKAFLTTGGLSYHVSNAVCRGPKQVLGKRKKSQASGKSFPRIRGKDEDRTCPHCSKKFTSVLGCEYHVQKGVCFKKQAQANIPYATLQPGLKFVTAFGIVQVVRDDRAVPAVPTKETRSRADEPTEKQGTVDNAASGDEKPPSAEPKHKKRKSESEAARAYRTAVDRHEKQAASVRSSHTILAMVRRRELSRAYKAGKITQDTVWQAQYGKDPRDIPAAQHVILPTLQPVDAQDPNAPASSFPDRLVECRWVRDDRTRCLDVDEQLPALDSPSSLKDGRPNVFLQRRLLIEPYSEEATTYICSTCGQKYSSRPGAVYHHESNKCGGLPPADGSTSSKKKNLVKVWNEKAMNILKRKEARRAEGKSAPVASFPVVQATSIRSNFVREKAAQALAAIEAERNAKNDRKKALPPSATSQKASNLHQPARVQGKDRMADDSSEVKVLAKTRKEKMMELDPSPSFADPRKVLADLQAELKFQQSVIVGPIYPAVWKALNFQKPGAKKKRKRRTAAEIQRENERIAIRKAIKKENEARAMLAKERSKVFFPETNAGHEISSIPLMQVKMEDPRQTETPLDKQKPASTSVSRCIPVHVDKETLKSSAASSSVEGTARNSKNDPTAAVVQQSTESSVSRNVDLTLDKDNQTQPQGQPRFDEDDECKVLAEQSTQTASMLKQKPLFEYGKFLASFPDRPPMVDTRVLVQEIDAGRYPSINRKAAQKTDTGLYAGKCPICRSAEPVLLKCNFCPRSVHITCARLKYTLPDPEPYDDFICTVCIQSITHRRNRAERRRIERTMGVEVAATTPSVMESSHPPIPLHREVVPDLEYEAVVSQGRYMVNLLDLEADARARLQREMDSAKLTNLRRQMMM